MKTLAADRLIEACVSQYRDCGIGNYQITQRPEIDNRTTKEVDAIAEAHGVPPLAIEHTALQSFAGQLMDDQQIQKVYHTVVADVAPHVGRGISCVIPVRAFKRGFDWENGRKALATHILSVANTLTIGDTPQSIPELPFSFTLTNNPDFDTPFFVARSSPGEARIANELTASMEVALQHKRPRLAEYLASGFSTQLLLESQDTALISHAHVYKAFLRAQGTVGAHHLSDVIYAQTGHRPRIYWFCFLGPQSLRDCVNRPNFKLGPEFRDEWEGHL